MNVDFGPSLLSLPRDGLVALRDAKGTRIECLQGAVWITEEGEARDVVLNAESGFTVLHDGLTLLMALQPASLRLREVDQHDVSVVERILSAASGRAQTARLQLAASL